MPGKAATKLSAVAAASWMARRQRFLWCLRCGELELCACGLCRCCYGVVYRDRVFFAGAKERVLERDRGCCQVCGISTNIVHHRRPGVHEEPWLITICAGCHATIERLQWCRHYLPPTLLELWQEQHPTAGAQQLQLAIEGDVL